MAILIKKESCVGCGICADACPFAAIELMSGQALMSDKCVQCGACVKACPMDAIVREAAVDTTPVGEDKSQYQGVWVYAEVQDRKIRSVCLELLGAGRRLAEEMQCNLSAVLLGEGVANLAAELFEHGADQVYLAEAPELAYYNHDAYTATLHKLVQEHKPSVLLLGATHDGRDLGPRLACRLGTGLTADCTSLGIDEESGLVAWTRPAFGGNIMATILCPEHRPQMGTVRPSVFKCPTPETGRTGEIIRVSCDIDAAKLRTRLLEVKKAGAVLCNLEEAEIIVAGGRGMGKEENFSLLQALADALGGSVGASRAAVDAGWAPQVRQVGQTGKTVGPKIYIACGISGAIQHVAGMSSADVVIAINKDEDAPIFRIADYGIVGDVLEVIPALLEQCKRAK